MKRIDDVQLMSGEGPKPVVTYDRWTKKIGDLTFEFALHADGTQGNRNIKDLVISELTSGADTGTRIRHPRTGAQLTEACFKNLTPREIRSAARSALHNHLDKVGHANFIAAVLRAQIQGAKVAHGQLPDTELGRAIKAKIQEGKDATAAAS
jgi:hypothetical protein